MVVRTTLVNWGAAIGESTDIRTSCGTLEFHTALHMYTISDDTYCSICLMLTSYCKSDTSRWWCQSKKGNERGHYIPWTEQIRHDSSIVLVLVKDVHFNFRLHKCWISQHCLYIHTQNCQWQCSRRCLLPVVKERVSMSHQCKTLGCWELWELISSDQVGTQWWYLQYCRFKMWDKHMQYNYRKYIIMNGLILFFLFARIYSSKYFSCSITYQSINYNS